MWFKLVPVGFFLSATMCSVFDFSSEFFFQLWGGFCVSVPVCCRAQEAPGTAWSLCVALSHLSWVLNGIFQLLSFISPLSAFLALEPAVLSWVWLLSAVTKSSQVTLRVVAFSLPLAVCTHTPRGKKRQYHTWWKTVHFQRFPKASVSHSEWSQSALCAPCYFFHSWKGLSTSHGHHDSDLAVPRELTAHFSKGQLWQWKRCLSLCTSTPGSTGQGTMCCLPQLCWLPGTLKAEPWSCTEQADLCGNWKTPPEIRQFRRGRQM